MHFSVSRKNPAQNLVAKKFLQAAEKNIGQGPRPPLTFLMFRPLGTFYTLYN